MKVVFYKLADGRCCGWTAEPRKRRCFQGTTTAAGKDLPHDLAQFVVESLLKIDLGFWGLLARGATFKSVPGRRQTRPGRELISMNLKALDAAEVLANKHVTAWRNGVPTPAASALDAMHARWQTIQVGEGIQVEWRMQGSCLPAPHSFCEIS